MPLPDPIQYYLMWKEGEAHKYYNEEVGTMHRAAKLALADLNHHITKDEPYKTDGFYIVADENDRFKITLRKVEDHITEVKIRINFMGDKPYAELIYQYIDGHVNTIEFDDQGRPTKAKLITLDSQ
jgi:hypothetical protein